jgi:glutamate-ammonia-ligase adenylyltransferase
VPTAEGALYEVDTRLRPQGTQGPLAVGFDSFARYQREEAWTWEHMALIRARVLFGSEAARAELGAIIGGVLGAERDKAKVTAEVQEMRDKMAAHKAAKGVLDVKLLRGDWSMPNSSPTRCNCANMPGCARIWSGRWRSVRRRVGCGRCAGRV